MTQLLTIGGCETPSNFEITVDGTIKPISEDPFEDAIIASGTTVEGAVDSDHLEFQFSGEVTDITVTGGKTDVEIDGEAVDPAEYVA
ncbi:hypothetical protein [Halostagnicola sp. A-GB9-2]|uniref:hypothetical protein n=1 Tax=Halostagnicola sp. A-GB9-2 TaxID=3048066 RepID=UPI0024BF4B80|nr:hypothetical protein [Halostagnicola sp. A-GB9-2]MDJ1432566.1 hypothetical protein [Halostagnicola sp. A-GB9-2]